MNSGLCACGCGDKTRIAETNNKKYGDIKGSPRRYIKNHHSKTHGMTNTREHTSWAAMRYRCNNPNNPDYWRYGGRGITVCRRWSENFENFFTDMGKRPLNCSLDRIDNNGDYSKENCRWATPLEQNRNTSVVRLYELNGERRCVADFSSIYGINISTIKNRMRRLGWTIQKALLTPLDNRGSYERKTRGRSG